MNSSKRENKIVCPVINNCLAGHGKCTENHHHSCCIYAKRKEKLRKCEVDSRYPDCNKPQLCMLIPANIDCCKNSKCIWDTLIPARLILGQRDENDVNQVALELLKVTARKYVTIEIARNKITGSKKAVDSYIRIRERALEKCVTALLIILARKRLVLYQLPLIPKDEIRSTSDNFNLVTTLLYRGS